MPAAGPRRATRCSRWVLLSSIVGAATLWFTIGSDLMRSQENVSGNTRNLAGFEPDDSAGTRRTTDAECGAAPALPETSAETVVSEAERMSVARAFIRNMTRQCSRVYFDAVPSPVLFRDGHCPDIESSIARATRPVRPVGAHPNFDFTPLNLPDCQLRWYTPQEACDVVEAQGHLIMIGDSLVRHLSNALFMIMSNNYMYGALRNPLNTQDLWHECVCDGQFGGYPACHGGIGMSVDYWEMVEGAPQSSAFCPSWGQENRIHFLGSYGNSQEGYPDATVERLLSTSGTGKVTIYAANGIGYVPNLENPVQNRIDTEAAYKYQWSKTLKYASTYNNTRLIFGTVLAHHGFRPCQTEEALMAYNDWVRELARTNADLGIEIFDGRALTRDAVSMDNVHFLSHDNVLLAQILLNMLAKRPQKRRTRPAAVNRDPRGRKYRNGPLQIKYDQQAVDPATKWWLGGQYDLRGCRCFPDWSQRLQRNTTASVCHCRAWCDARITPEFLTHYTADCERQGGNMNDPATTHTCKYSCRPDHQSQYMGWHFEACGTVGCPWPEDRCKNCDSLRAGKK